MKRISLSRSSEWVVLLLIAFSILWRGGKGIESTLLLALVAGFVTLIYSARKILRIRHRLPDGVRTGLPKSNAQVPLSLWGVAFLFVLWTLLSWIFSDTRNYGLDEVIRDASLLLLFLWIVRAGVDGMQGALFDRFVRFVAYGAISSSIVGLFVYMLQPANRFVGTFFYIFSHADYWPNAWAEFVLLSWPFVLIAYIREQRTRVKRLLLCGFTLLLTSLLLSYSRGGLLVFCVQMLLGVGFLITLALHDVRFRRTLRMQRSRTVICFLAITASAFLLAGCINVVRSTLYTVQSAQEKITFTAAEGTSSIQERIQFWKQALTLSFHHPLLGYGPYSFRFEQPWLAEGVLQTSDHPHNVLLKLAMERGWPAVFLFVLLIAAVLWKSLLAYRRDAASILMMISVLGVLLHNLIDYNLQFVAIALPFWLSLGFLVVPESSEQSIVTSFGKWKRAQYLSYVKILAAIVILCVTGFESISLASTALARSLIARGELSRSLYWYGFSDHTLFGRDIYLKEAELSLQRSKLIDAQEFLSSYRQQNSVDYRFWKLQGVLQFRQGDIVAAKDSLKRAFEIGKYMDLDILHLVLSTAKTEQDRQQLLPGKMIYDAVFSDFSDAILHNTHYVSLSQNPEYLMAVSRDLGKLFPSDAKRYTVIARKAYNEASILRKNAAAQGTGFLW